MWDIFSDIMHNSPKLLTITTYAEMVHVIRHMQQRNMAFSQTKMINYQMIRIILLNITHHKQ